jgi:2-polyprenyl-6-methoxyphenol hydroxylase-like FAD-dependent oxidoreductase
MRHTDVVVVGGGLAGSLAAAMLGRAGIDTVVIDPHLAYPPDFRCEKLDGPQLQTLELTGIAEAIVAASTPDRVFWVARAGRLVEKRAGDQRGILYDALVNTIRSQIPVSTEFWHAKVVSVSTSPDRQTVKLSNGDEISARLIVLATGLNVGLLHKLGIERQVISAGHSTSIGFDIHPQDGQPFHFPSLTYFSERPEDLMAYITLFPIGRTMRANLFGYRTLHDPWLSQFRQAPTETLSAMWPRLRDIIGGYVVKGDVKIRPVDLVTTSGYQQDGIALVGDAFGTSCPAAGTGARKALVDVERLCNVHIPQWLRTPGMDAAKIKTFYADPAKQECDTRSLKKAYELRSFSIDRGFRWALLRWGKFWAHRAKGALRPWPDHSQSQASEPADPSLEQLELRKFRL